MKNENDQREKMRMIHCLLCNVSKPFKGFLSHIRQEHLNYQRYKCTKCAFKSDDEDDSILHSFEKNHDLKFSNANYQEHLAVKIFQDCWREQFTIQHEIGKRGNVISGQTKRVRNWNSCSDMQKACNRKKPKTSDACLSNSLRHEVSLQTKLENQKDCGVASNSTKCVSKVLFTLIEDMQLKKSVLRKKAPIFINLDNDKKSESGIHITKVLSETVADNSEPYKLSEPDDQTPYALGSFSVALENTKTVGSEKFLNAHTVDNVFSIDGEASRSKRNTFGPKKRALEDVGVNYIAKKTHALQFHFTQDDDPEIAELLPATVKACFPHSLCWSDYQCTECGKTLGTYSSRRNHVLKEHFYWSAVCPLSGCRAVISAHDNLEEHFQLEHNISKLKMPKDLKQKFRKVENDRKNDLNRQLHQCFPCSLPPKKQVTIKEVAYDAGHLPKPSITSILSSLLHSQPVSIAKKTNFTYSSSDDESSSFEDENDSGIKGEDHDVMNEKDATASTGCSKNLNDSDSSIICHNLRNHEKLSDIEGKEQ
uniref:C2H2-type domain-containing protein n=1 Tax=Elaeophora elaphi TaxID=1147741 RepID=A0A158Q725_9BILA